jgi:hypothetical protein
MNANQTRIGGVRKSLGQWIDARFGGMAKPGRARTRTKATLAVEGLEGRVVLSGTSTVGPSAISKLALKIVTASENYTLQQPQQLPAVINYLESPTSLSFELSSWGIPQTVSTSVFAYGTSDLDNVLQYSDFAVVDSIVAIDLLTHPTSIPSADVAAAFVTSYSSSVSAISSASAWLTLYKAVNVSAAPVPTQLSQNAQDLLQSQQVVQSAVAQSTSTPAPSQGSSTQSQGSGQTQNVNPIFTPAVVSQAVASLSGSPTWQAAASWALTGNPYDAYAQFGSQFPYFPSQLQANSGT